MPETERLGLLNRTMQTMREVWREVADRTSGIFYNSPNPELPDKDIDTLKEQMRECLEARGGEVSARARAANLGRTYLALNTQGRKRFLKVLAQEFDIDRIAVDKAVAELQKPDMTVAERLQAEQNLRQALQPPRLRLLTQFNGLPEGVHFLVDLRAELLEFRDNDPYLIALERDLKSLLTSWFDVGFLELKRINWHSPAALLEKLIAYEAVHAIKSWDDLKNRLDLDRRCFAFFHPRMPYEPLIFIEVALVNGIAQNVHALLDEKAPVIDPNTADTAIFYSISNAQEGLAGISFGNFLIKRVVDELVAEFKNVKTFATLSPIPNFRQWLNQYLEKANTQDGEPDFLSNSERKALTALPLEKREHGIFRTLLETPNIITQSEYSPILKAPLMRLCAQYLSREKRPQGIAYDRVAHFHLSNGARIERLNWLADISEKGIAQSLGMMVNYRYKLDDIEANHEAYTGEHQIKVSSSIRSLLRA